MLAREFTDGEVAKLVNEVGTLACAGNNVIRLLSVRGDTVVLREQTLEGRDLSGVVFRGHSLEGTSFRGANLSNTEFRGCDLGHCAFDGALLENTTFELTAPAQLAGAQFGTLNRFRSIRANGHFLQSYDDARSWLETQATAATGDQVPCAAAQQLRLLFRKFVWLDGSGRRDELPRRAAERGKHFVGAPPSARVVDVSVRHGYLSEDLRWQAVRRAEGARYREIVEYVVRLAPGDGIKAILDELCGVGCVHVPQWESD